MASAQLHRPSDQTNRHHVQSTTNHKKTESTHHDTKNHSEHVKLTTHHKKTESTHHDNKNHSTSEHSFTDKVKEMAHSARKIFNNQDHQQGHAAFYSQAHKPAGTGPGEKKKVRNADGHERHCMPRMMKKKKGKASKYGSDSGSSSDSDKEKARKKH